MSESKDARPLVTVWVRTDMVLVCPSCGKHKDIPSTALEEKKIPPGKPVPVRCGCGALFRVAFDRRSKYRKKVSLFGEFSRGYAGEPETILIRNLSRSGVGFDVLDKDLREVERVESLAPGDQIQVEFKLDTENRQFVQLSGVVRFINKSYVGAETKIIQEHVRRIVGYYLMK